MLNKLASGRDNQSVGPDVLVAAGKNAESAEKVKIEEHGQYSETSHVNSTERCSIFLALLDAFSVGAPLYYERS